MDLHSGPPQAAPRRVIALEFNELCPALLAQWMADGTLPNFARLHAQSDVFTTRPDVADSALLEPWIQWYSLHTGLAYDAHRVFHLTEGLRAGHRDIYRMLIEAGRRVASFASMNLAAFDSPGSVYVADPWSHADNASPPELNLYNRFVAHNVREYSNASDRMSAGDYARFGLFMARHGLSARTIAQVARQLAGEMLGDPRQSYKRVALLDALQFDLFASYYRAGRFGLCQLLFQQRRASSAQLLAPHGPRRLHRAARTRRDGRLWRCDLLWLSGDGPSARALPHACAAAGCHAGVHDRAEPAALPAP